MGKLIYSMLMSLDGYVEDERGRFGWGAPEDEEVHSYINQHQPARVISRHLPLRAEDVRDDDVPGDRTHGSQPAAVRARLGAAVAGGREDRLLQNPRRTAPQG
jgi:hypothetical protein